MALENILQSEINQTKTNTAWFDLYVKFKKQMTKYNKTETESQMQRANRLPEGKVWGEERNKVREIECTHFKLQNKWITHMKQCGEHSQ